jgi:glutathione S-transferase
MLNFYYTPTACSTASHIALEESGAPYEANRVKLYTPEAAAFYEINPKGTVPALKADGVVVTENVAILMYIARKFPEARLLPPDLLQEALCLSIMAWFASTVHITRRQARVPERFSGDESTHSSIRLAGRETFWRHLQTIDAMFADKTWIMGEQFTVADCYAIVFYHWGLIDELPMAELVHYTAFKERMVARPGVLKVLQRERSILAPSK